MEYYGNLKNDPVGYSNSIEMLLGICSRLCGYEVSLPLGSQSCAPCRYEFLFHQDGRQCLSLSTLFDFSNNVYVGCTIRKCSFHKNTL